MSEILTVDLDKAEVLAALFNGARTQGAGFVQYSNTPMSALEARLLIERSTYFDYVQGRVMKIDLSGDSFDPWLYDRDNGQGAAERVINALRTTNMVNPEEIEIQHLEGTRKAAKEAREELGTKASVDVRGNIRVISMGFEDLADVIRPKLDAILGDEDDFVSGLTIEVGGTHPRARPVGRRRNVRPFRSRRGIPFP